LSYFFSVYMDFMPDIKNTYIRYISQSISLTENNAAAEKVASR